MTSKFNEKQKLELVNRVKKGESVTKICQEAGISRVLLYRWVNLYKNFQAKPLNTLTPTQRFEMVERVIKYGRPVSEVARAFGVSRLVLYRWIERYKAAPEGQKMSAMESKPSVPNNPARRIDPESIRSVLKIAGERPELSHRQVAQLLPRNEQGNPIVGNHGVYNVLLRSGLTNYDSRLAYAQAQAVTLQPPIYIAPLYIPAIPIFKLRQLLAPFITVPKLIFVRSKQGLLLAFIYLSASILLFFWIRLILNTAYASPLGLFFASIALFFGFVFFLYSMKYYITVLLVLRLAQSGASDSSLGMLGKLGKKLGLGRKQEGRVNPLSLNLDKVELRSHPFVSIHVALYNERRVVERLIRACEGQEYYEEVSKVTKVSNVSKGGGLAAHSASSGPAAYEVIIADDSTDETTEMAKQLLSSGGRILDRIRMDSEMEIYVSSPSVGSSLPVVKLIHRFSRSGFKGAALQRALENTNPKAEYISVFDADFVPYPDTLSQFVKTFQELGEGGRESWGSRGSRGIAAVQGYQWHVLNKSQTWITRGVRTEYAGSYVIERAGEEIYGGLKQIAGSVYAIRADILRQFGWGTSITEDFELTLRLYEAGYKVAFTPYIQAPAEAVSTIKRLVRQRMRWAEGASYNIKVMLPRLLFGRWEDSQEVTKVTNESKESNVSETVNQRVWRPSGLTRMEKLEFAYLAPYYLQAAFFVIGTFSWFIAEAIMGARLPFWTAALGWSLVFTNILALPLMNIVGLFLEESDERDYIGILSFVALSYIVVPFQAYAAIKGFLESEEGPWFRTPKTGAVTDTFGRSGFGKFFGNILGKKPQTAQLSKESWGSRGSWGMGTVMPAMAFSSTFRPFQRNSFAFKRRQVRRIWSRPVLVGFVIFTLFFNYFALFVPQVGATNPTDSKWYNKKHTAAQVRSRDRALYCVSSTDCKIVWADGTLVFRDCDNAVCGTNTTTILDGAGCVLTGCSTTITVGSGTGDASIYCVAADDCKIAYLDGTNQDLRFADCDNAACTSGTVTTVDSTNLVGKMNSIYCLSSTDCKISYRDQSTNDLKMIDCDDATCGTQATGSPATVDSALITNPKSSITCPAADDCKIAYFESGGSSIKLADCGSANCTTVTLTVVDGDTGCPTGCSTTRSADAPSISCPTASDCKISYYDSGTNDMRFVDCGDGACATSNTYSLLDGAVGCTLTGGDGCDTGDSTGQDNSIFCPAADNCKIAYNEIPNGILMFADCDDANCASGSVKEVDGGLGTIASCSVTDCNVANDTRDYSIYCPAADDCKVFTFDVAYTSHDFIDCDDATCSSGTLVNVTPDQLINGTVGSAAQTIVENSTGVAGNKVTFISNVKYPTGSLAGSLSTSAHTLHLHFTNGITSGTMTWHYHIGYCTVASGCTAKTVHATSADQSYTSATTSPQDISVTPSATTSIPGPAESSYLYIEIHETAAATGNLTLRMNDSHANTADTYTDFPSLTVPEYFGFLIPVAPFLPKIAGKIGGGLRTGKKSKSRWGWKRSP